MKSKKYIYSSIVFFMLFFLLIILLKTVGVTGSGPEGTLIGLSAVNVPFHNLTGVNWTLYKITGVTGAIALLIVPFFGLIGLLQLIKRKSIFKVDRGILCLGALYVVTGFFYVLFEKIIINYRPVIFPDEVTVEASFPSSHTLLSCVIFISLIMVINRYFQKNNANTIVKGICIILLAVTVLGRLFSGVHWFTDILGGNLLSMGLLYLFKAAIQPTKKRKNPN